MQIVSACLSIILWIAAPAVSAATLDIFVCSDGKLARQTVDPSEVGEYRGWVRQGNAVWTNGHIDEETAHALAESRGIWGLLALKDLFSWFGTATQPDVLASIALNESGRNGRPWPWTINWQGRPYYFPAKEPALEFAQGLIARGETVFDIGLMQINWHFHRNRLKTLEEAFNPVANVRVADAIVQGHFRQTGSMTEAVGRYHSKTPSKKRAYLGGVAEKYQKISIQSTTFQSRVCS